MPAFNFQKRFVPMVETGLRYPMHPDAKTQTIRARRKDERDPLPGDMLYLYSGMRTKSCRKLGQAECKSAEPIFIVNTTVKINGQELTFRQVEELAKADGFNSILEFFNFIQEQHDGYLNGYLYKW